MIRRNVKFLMVCVIFILAAQASLTFANSNLFIPYIIIPISSAPEAVAIGDINNDGRNDVVMTTSYSFDPENDFKLFVFLQNASGTLDPPVKYDTSGAYTTRPTTVAIGDVNNDGMADVVVGNRGLNIEVFLQNGLGGLDPSQKYVTVDSDKIRIGDFNNDGLLDVVGIDSGTTNTASVFLQNIGGNFNSPDIYSVNGSYGDLDIGDINDDGLTDIIVMSGLYDAYGTIGVLTQTAAGTFSSAVYYYLGDNEEHTIGVGVGDVNGDGLKDVVVTYGGNARNSSKIGIFLQNATGTLNPAISYNSYDYPEPVEIADVNRDGRQDIIVAHADGIALGVYLQGAVGTLASEELYPLPYATYYNRNGLAVGDINSDGGNDIVIADYNNGLVVLYDRPLFHAEDYFPLDPGTIWQYLKNGQGGVSRKVLNKEVTVKGIKTRPVKFIEENIKEYLTSDSNGIFLHREYQPHIYVGGFGWVDIDTTFIPPIKLAEGDVWIGQSFHSSGIARTVVWPMGSIFNFNYTADSTIEAEESVTVPAGTFDTIRYHESISGYGLTLSATRYLAKGIGIVKDIATNPQGKTSTFELISMTGLTLLAPNGGEIIPSGGTYDITWKSSPDMTIFRLAYSLDNGVTWIPIPGAKNVTENHYLWTVPIPAKNKKSCRIKVSGYNGANIEVKTDISDSPFTMEVVKVTSPDGSEVWTSGELHSITWMTNDTIKPVTKVKLFYTKNNGITWLPITTITGGNPGTFDWIVPSLTSAKKNCKVKVVLRDSAGNSIGSDISEQVFKMQPSQ